MPPRNFCGGISKMEAYMELRDKHGLTEAEFLAQYRPKDYERPSVTADIAVFREHGGHRELLLIRRGGHPFLGKWALPGGFSDKGESVAQTAARELVEETHLQNLPMEPVGLFSDPGRDPRAWVMSEAYAALLKTNETAEAGDDAADAAWFRVDAADSGETRTLHFSGTEEFTAVLEKKTVPGLKGGRAVYRILDAGGLAFDHAKIIACAWDGLL
jgi:8-oxo-dGTP diphosphatase